MSLHARQQGPMWMMMHHVIGLTVWAIPLSEPIQEQLWTSQRHFKQPKSQGSLGPMWPKEESLLKRCSLLEGQAGDVRGGLLHSGSSPLSPTHWNSHKKWWPPSFCSTPALGGASASPHLLWGARESMQTPGWPPPALLHKRNNASFWCLCLPPSPASSTWASISF